MRYINLTSRKTLFIAKAIVLIVILIVLLGILWKFADARVVTRFTASPTPEATTEAAANINDRHELPECFLGRCPEYFSMEVDGNPNTYESVVVIPIGMTKAAGKVWIIGEGKVIFETAALAQINIKENESGNGFTISYLKDWSDFKNLVFANAEYRYQDGKFVLVGGEEPQINSYNGEVCDNYTEITKFGLPFLRVAW